MLMGASRLIENPFSKGRARRWSKLCAAAIVYPTAAACLALSPVTLVCHIGNQFAPRNSAP